MKLKIRDNATIMASRVITTNYVVWVAGVLLFMLPIFVAAMVKTAIDFFAFYLPHFCVGAYRRDKKKVKELLRNA